MLRSLALALCLPTAGALQLTPEMLKGTRELQVVNLDEKEVASRGSHCIDGSNPGIYHQPGTDDGHWVFWFQGGGVCNDEADCVSYLSGVPEPAGTMDSEPLQAYGAFANYHHVFFPNCDLGLYIGDRDEPVSHNGHTMYFQGARIVKHVVDIMSANYSMTDVLFSGGSGGGQALYAGADYFKSLMPSTVTRFGVAPMNGWYAEGGIDELKDLYTMANMESTISEGCKQAFAEGERHNCIDPATSYKYIEANVFMVQIFDYTFEWNATDSAITTAYNACLSEPSSACTDEGVELLQEHLDNYTSKLKTYPKYTEHGQGGFLSTCTTHSFYNDDTFNQYANNGVTAGAAIEQWWESLGTNPPPVWYLPCQLGTSKNAQCESSC